MKRPLLHAIGVAAVLAAAAAQARTPRPRPFVFPASEKQRVLQRVAGHDWARTQFAELKTRAEQGDADAAALLFAVHGEPRYADVVRRALLHMVSYHGPRLDQDIAAGGHREGYIWFYWDTREARWYDLVHSDLSADERQRIEGFFRKLGRYWIDSFNRWTTTPNLTFPVRYHAAVIGYVIDDRQLIDWGLQDRGKFFGGTRGGLFPVLNAMLRDDAVWDEATIYAVVNVLRPMLQWCILQKLYDGTDLYNFQTARGASVRKLVDGYLALGYPRERTGLGTGSFRVATYGDGSTMSPFGHHAEDLYLVNKPYKHGESTEMTGLLELAYYVSRDPKYAWFLAQAPDRPLALLYGEPIDPTSVAPPSAPSTVFTEAGIAMLRADESPAYWTSDGPAVLQLASKWYGHDHRDKLSINLHGAGRLLYPDLNCVQYESNNVHWTRNGIAHNTLLIDRQDPADAPYRFRHEFAPEVKFLATTAECYPGVVQTRALALTRDYLLDLFSARSEVPHLYDWVIHAIGRLEMEHPQLDHSTRDLIQDYWWIEDERGRQTSRTWRATVVQRNGLAVPGEGCHGPEWFQDRACVRLTMIGEPETSVRVGSGPSGGPPADPERNPEGHLPLIVVRRHERATVFAAVHEPYKDAPRITEARKVVARDEAYVAEVCSGGFIDRVAVTFGPQTDLPEQVLRSERDPREVFAFRNFGYLRFRPSPQPRLVARGGWTAFQIRCPQLPATGALTLNGKEVVYIKEGDYVRYGDRASTRPTGEVTVALEQDLPAWAVPGQEVVAAWTVRNWSSVPVTDVRIRPVAPASIRCEPEGRRVESLPPGGITTTRFTFAPIAATAQPASLGVQVSHAAGDRRRVLSVPCQDVFVKEPLEVVLGAEPISLPKQGTGKSILQVVNWSPQAVRPKVKLNLPQGIAATVGDVPRIAAGQTAKIPIAWTTAGTVQGTLAASVQLADGVPGRSDRWTSPAPLRLCVGPVLLEDQSFPAFGEYVIYSPGYTLRLSQLHGVSRFFRSSAGRPLYEKTFWNRRTSAERGEIAPEALPAVYVDGQPALAWDRPAQFLWPKQAPASVIVGSAAGRLEWTFEEDRIRIAPVALWTAEKPHEVVFPSRWLSWGGPPKWLRVVSVDQEGKERVLETAPNEPTRFLAAALGLPGQEQVIAFGVDRPQTARFRAAELRFTVGPGEAFWFGLCRPDSFDSWRKPRPVSGGGVTPAPAPTAPVPGPQASEMILPCPPSLP